MSHASDAELLVLHGLRLKSFAQAEWLAESVGIPTDEVQTLLERFEEKQWVRHREGVITGWTLSPTGREEAERRVTDELASIGARPTVEAAYDRFASLNPALLQVCTDWQLREVAGVQVINDHSDASYDVRVISVLSALDVEVQPICSELANVFERFDGYRIRFATALARVEAGEGDWFAKPMIDSYHTVWFELHENFIATLGLERGKEVS